MANNSQSLARKQLKSTLENFGEEEDVNVEFDPNDRFVNEQIDLDSTDSVMKVGFIGERFDKQELKNLIKNAVVNGCTTLRLENVQICTAPSSRDSGKEHKYYVVF